MGLFLNGVLALSQGVPQLDGLVSGSRHDLSVVGRESDAENVLSVVFEPAGGVAGAQVPEPEGLVPGAREGEVAVRGQDDVGDEVSVTLEAHLGDAVVGFVPGDLPHDQGFVAGA